MTPRELVYIAGPYAGSPRAEVELNVRKARTLGQFATFLGKAPVVPHAIGYLGCHGCAYEGEPGVRDAALECGEALAHAVAAQHGSLWVLLNPEGQRSTGTDIEYRAWFMHSAIGADLVEMRWPQWCDYMRRMGFNVDRSWAEWEERWRPAGF